MTIGNFNPRYDGTPIRPAHVSGGAGERLWHEPGKRLAAQDINGIIAKFRHAMDAYGVADAEGDDTLMTALLQALASDLIAYGTWTPVLTAATAGDLVATLSTATGNYVRTGKLYTCAFSIQTSTFTHTTASGAARITGLPATAAISLFGAVERFGGVTKANYTHMGAAASTTNPGVLTFAMSGSAQSANNLAITDMPSGGTVILRGVVYFTVA